MNLSYFLSLIFLIMDSSLYNAIKSGNTDQLKQVVASNATADDLYLLHQKTHLNNTTLHVSVQFNRFLCAEEICKRCPSSVMLTQTNSKGDTPLHIASRLGLSKIASFLVNQSKINHNESGGNGDGGLMVVRMGNNKNDTALHEAVRNRQFEIVKLLTEADPGFEYFANNAGETPLYLAVEGNMHDIVVQILETCPSSAHGGPLGRTALHAAVVKTSYSGTISLLLKKRPTIIKEADDYGCSALHYAAYYGLVDKVIKLLEADPSVVYIPDKGGKSALHIAASMSERNSVIEELTRRCPDCWELLDSKGRNFLHVAAENGIYDVFDYVTRKNMIAENLINQPDNDGNTPLHLASMSNTFTTRTAKILSNNYKVNNNVMNKDNLTALDLIKNDKDAYKDLKKAGAGHSWRNKKESMINDEEAAMLFPLKNTESSKHKRFESLQKMSEAHLVVATLIAIITFATGFALPGIFNRDDMTALTRKPAFIAFLASNTIAMLLSTFAVFILLLSKFIGDVQYSRKDYHMKMNFIVTATVCTFIAIIAMVSAFVTGTYAMLIHSPGLAIPLFVIGCSFFPLCGIFILKICKFRFL